MQKAGNAGVVCKSETGDGEVIWDGQRFHVIIDGHEDQSFAKFTDMQTQMLPVIAITKWGWIALDDAPAIDSQAAKHAQAAMDTEGR